MEEFDHRSGSACMIATIIRECFLDADFSASTLMKTFYSSFTNTTIPFLDTVGAVLRVFPSDALSFFVEATLTVLSIGFRSR